MPTPELVPFDHVISIDPSPSLLILLQVQINSGALWWISIQVLHFSAAVFLSEHLLNEALSIIHSIYPGFSEASVCNLRHLLACGCLPVWVRLCCLYVVFLLESAHFSSHVAAALDPGLLSLQDCYCCCLVTGWTALVKSLSPKCGLSRLSLGHGHSP